MIEHIDEYKNVPDNTTVSSNGGIPSIAATGTNDSSAQIDINNANCASVATSHNGSNTSILLLPVPMVAALRLNK